ncbi:phage tail sheath subtilisin-like domain-containing protein [Jatrophihabitans telluris]|uniref:Phage tail sheath subtilisin-like domain-containing protein n=1 Tax=Jatrophihabitans telluris TaxID=2038343 RepID=A0ABY4QX90_9ACTN|nr:phage tail sheath C-terminal domain-containing protein [Jatrophihabitans telluris]UQX88103.1 phage tail sheath subtilisin-like domain-containing protein [Jatrophihabitans telluris]
MPIAPTYPGVYIDELPSAVRTIIGVPTSIAAFVGWAARGPDYPVHITSFADYEQSFGGLNPRSPMSYAVYQFYQNGGMEAEVVRLAGGGDTAKATITLPAGGGSMVLSAVSVGTWGNGLRARVDWKTKDPTDGTLYNLSVFDPAGVLERYLNVSTDTANARSASNLLSTSSLVRLESGGDARPDEQQDAAPGRDPFVSGTAGQQFIQGTGGIDGNSTLASADYLGGNGTNFGRDKLGLYALLKTDIFNILCLPGAQDMADIQSAALQLCLDRRSMLVVDPPATWTSVAAAQGQHPLTGDSTRNAALYFPNVMVPDPLQDGRSREFAPCGVLAGVWARTDVQRGVWKAPAGTAASLNGVTAPSVPMTDLENGELNPLAVNCLRSFPVIGPVSWGARTMRGADRLADQWKYLPVRRLALFIEESLFRGTQWVVFEPNDEPLWSSIRLNVGAFMNSLFRQGAFQGRTPQDAYLVKCDAQNNPQNDIDRGIVNILVGFAPLKPAEFVIIHIQQLAGQIQV